jgi:hypothetical protein
VSLVLQAFICIITTEEGHHFDRKTMRLLIKIMSECDRIVAWHFDGHINKKLISMYISTAKPRHTIMHQNGGYKGNPRSQNSTNLNSPDATGIICSMTQSALKQQWFDIK